MSKRDGDKSLPTERFRLISLTTTSMSCEFLQRGQLSFLVEHGFDVTAIASPGLELQRVGEREGVNVVPILMTREIHPLKDIVSLFRLCKIFRRIRPHIVNAGTPKAGMLGMLAAWLTGVPIRIYTQRGLRLETCKGWKLRLLTATERITCRCATNVVFVSNSLLNVCVKRRLVLSSKAVVIGGGSSNGVDSRRFLNSQTQLKAAKLRKKLGLPGNGPVIGFVGRLTRDKGICELLEAFNTIHEHYPLAKLLLVGDFELGDPIDRENMAKLKSDPRIVITGMVRDVSPYYELMTVLAFPSRREGFPNVPLEAACAGVPTVGFAATGTVDAIEHDVTGKIVECCDTEAFAAALLEYLEDSDMLRRHGVAARHRAQHEFAPQQIWLGLLELYRQQLSLLKITVNGGTTSTDVAANNYIADVLHRTSKRNREHHVA